MQVMSLPIFNKLNAGDSHWPTLNEEEEQELWEAWQKVQRLSEQRGILGFANAGDDEELVQAWGEFLDGIVDKIYVLIGWAHNCGLPIALAWQEVQRANMAKSVLCTRCIDGKLPPEESVSLRERTCPDCNGTGRLVLRRSDGKVLKPSTWTAPDIAALVRNRLAPPSSRQSTNEQFRALSVDPPVVKP